MLFGIYLLVALTVVFFSIKCADYVDLLDKKTEISGAFIGGVILAAVTSLPELITSISAVTIVRNPELIIGNVLGSNLFNLAALCTLICFTVKFFAQANLAKSHLVTLGCTIVIYLAMIAAIIFGKSFSVLTLNSTSLLILVVYIISFRFMAGDESADSGEEDSSLLSVRQVVFRFVLMSLGLVGSSMLITYVTNLIAERYQLNASFAGALFLGIATSLPELTSSIALIRRNNYNAAMGNIVGSNLFNFTILLIGDLLVGRGSVYISSVQTKAMLVFGLIASLLMGIVLLGKRRTRQVKATPAIYGLLSLGIVGCYFGFLIYSV